MKRPERTEKFNVETLKRYVDWSSEDHKLLKSIQDPVVAQTDSILETFYQRVVDNPVARKVLADSDTTVDQLKSSMRPWLRSVFSHDIDDDIFQAQVQVGMRHVEVDLPQSYMLLGINVIRDCIYEIIANHLKDDSVLADRTIRALNKNLDIRSAIMLRSYQDDRDRILKDNVLSDNESILALGRMSASIAHEIKNPLAGISGAIQVLKDQQDPDDPRREIMDSVLEQVNRLGGTVKDLLDFARPVQLNYQRIQFREIYDSLKNILDNDPQFEMEIIFGDKATQELELYVDPVRLQGVFYNLFVNANEAVEGRGTIVLASEVGETTITIFVTDNGPGIADDMAQELFKPFATNKTHGTGLGLAIVAKIIESHEGSITYEPQSRGARFCVKLPRRPQS